MSEREKIVQAFAVLLICLSQERKDAGDDLAQVGLQFTVKSALAQLESCFCVVRVDETEEKVRIKIPKPSSLRILQDFVVLRLLYPAASHIPAPLSGKTKLRPTAKGLALLQKYCRHNGMLTDPVCSLLQSLHNTMALTMLPRDSEGQLKASTGLTLVLWQKIMGPEPSLWVPGKAPFPVVAPTLHNVAGQHSERFTECKHATGQSPFFHKFFSHPNSNAVTQYWESESGVRMFANASFETAKHTVTKDLCVSGKALWQWVMECTDTLCFQEAVAVVSLFVSNGLIKLIEEAVCESICFPDDMPPIVSRISLYHITNKGRSSSRWEHTVGDDFGDVGAVTGRKLRVLPAARAANDDSGFAEIMELYFSEIEPVEEFQKVLSLELVLEEPGLRVLFEEWLVRRQSSEPLLFLESYLDLKQAASNLEICASPTRARMASQLWRQVRQVVFKFLSSGSPLELNISGEIQDQIQSGFDARQEITPKAVAKAFEALDTTLSVVAQQQHDQLAYQAIEFGVGSKELQPQLKAYCAKQQLYYALNLMAADMILAPAKLEGITVA